MLMHKIMMHMMRQVADVNDEIMVQMLVHMNMLNNMMCMRMWMNILIVLLSTP